MTGGKESLPVVRRHLGALRSALGNLHRHAARTAEDLRTDADLRWTVERGLQVAAQNALDVATHIASAHGLDAPDYASAVDKLVELGALPTEFGRRFRNVAGFRNVLVHAYLDVDLAVLAHALNDGLEDFERFAREVEGWLAR